MIGYSLYSGYLQARDDSKQVPMISWKPWWRPQNDFIDFIGEWYTFLKLWIDDLGKKFVGNASMFKVSSSSMCKEISCNSYVAPNWSSKISHSMSWSISLTLCFCLRLSSISSWSWSMVSLICSYIFLGTKYYHQTL